MASDSPTVVVIGGPNGAGKSTIAPGLLAHLGVNTFVNADTIARGLSAMHPESRAFEAGRIMLRELRRLTSERETFAFETTLASRTFAPWLRKLRSGGYEIGLQYLWVQSAETAIERVARRVVSGGHDIPKDVIVRRWSRSTHNFLNLYAPLADYWCVYHNATGGPLRVGEGGRNKRTAVFDREIWSMMNNVQ